MASRRKKTKHKKRKLSHKKLKQIVLIAVISSGATLLVMVLIASFGPSSRAANSTTTWTVQGDFESNTVTGEGSTTVANLDTSTTAGSVIIAEASDTFAEVYDDSDDVDTGASTAEVTGGNLARVTGLVEEDLASYIPNTWKTPNSHQNGLAVASNGDIYIIAEQYLSPNGPNFGKYVPSTDTFTDLSSKITDIWGTTEPWSITYDSVNNDIYIGGASGKFGMYDIAGNTSTDLTSEISGFWSTNTVYAMTFDAGHAFVFLGGDGGKLAQYRPSTEVTTDKTSTISSFWSTSTIYSMTFDVSAKYVFIGGASGKFAYYNTNNGTSTDQSDEISGFWGGEIVYAMTYDSSANSDIYLGGADQEFAKYDPTGDTATDLNSKISAWWYSTRDIRSMTFDTVNDDVYFGGDNKEYGRYDPTGDSATDLGANISHWGNYEIYSLAYTGGKVFMGGELGEFTEYTVSGDTSADLASEVQVWGFHDDIYAAVMDTTADEVYMGNYKGKFGKYNPGTTTFTDKTSKLTDISWGTHIIDKLHYDVTSNSVYVSGGLNAAKLAVFDITGDSATDKTTKISGFLSRNYDSVMDTTNRVIYFGGANNDWGKYDIAGDTGTDLDAKISGFWSNKYLWALGWDSTNSAIYFGGNTGYFGKYDIAGDSATDQTDELSGFISSKKIASLTFDSTNDIVYIGADDQKFASYDPTGDSATDLTAKISGFWGSSFDLDAMTFDSTNALVYLGGESIEFAKYDTALATATDLSATNPTSGGMWGLLYDPETTYVYTQGDTGSWGRVQDPAATQTAQSNAIDTLSTNIRNATLTKNDTAGSGTITYQLSNDNGSTWETVTPAVENTFATTGTALKWKISLTSDATVQDISIAYDGYEASGTITDLKIDAAGDAIWKTISWTETLPTDTSISFRTRGVPTASGEGALSSASWSPSYSTSAGTTITDESSVIDPLYRWLEIELTLDSGDANGASTPQLDDFTLEYVANSSPVVSNVTASQGSDGVVTVGYDVTDADNATTEIALYYQLAGVTLNETLTDSDTTAITVSSGTNMPEDGATLLIDDEIITYTARSTVGVEGHVNDMQGTILRGFGSSDAAAHSSGTAVYVKAATTSGDIGSGISNGTTKSITWTANTDQDEFYGTAIMRVLADDGESAVQFGAANASSFNLDTKAPSGVSITIAADQATANRATLTIAASDDNTVTMNVTNDSGYGDDLVNTNAGTYVTYATSKTDWILEANPDTVYLQIKDTKGNVATDSAVTPVKPTSPALAEISNTTLDTPTYGMYLTWNVMAAPTPGFTNYKVYRKAGAGSYSSIKTETTRETNNYLDAGLTASTVYTYYIIMTDADGNISQRSSEIVGTTNGTLDTGEGPGSNDTTSPTISGTAPTATVDGTTVTITYSVTASGVTGDSTTTVGYIDYRLTDANFDSAGTLKASNNTSITDGTTITVVVSGLSARTEYYYRIGAEDPSGNKGTDDNSAAGYTFTTSSAPGGGGTVVSAPDTIPPTIIVFEVTEETAATAKVNIQTNELSTVRVTYGLEPGILDKEITKEGSENVHRIVVGDLEPNTIYYTRGNATDAAGNEARSGVEQFQTKDTAILIEVPIDEGDLTTTPVEQVQETYDDPLVVELNFDIPVPISQNKQVKEEVVDRLKQDFRQVLRHVVAGTLSQDPTSLSQFIEAASSELPSPSIIEGLPVTEVTAESAAFTWTTDVQSNSLVAIVPDTLYNANAEEPYLLELGNSTEFVTDHFVTITELRPATRYHYQIRSQGSLGPVAKSRDYEFQTLSEELSIIVAEVLEVEATRATVYWRTSVDADSLVEYIPLNENGEPVLDDVGSQGRTDKSTDHTVELRGLESGTGYLLRVISRDETGQSVDQFLQQIRTDRDNDAPIIGQINELSTLYPGDKPKVQTLITWRTNERANSQVIYWDGLREPSSEEDKILTPVDLEYTRNHVVVLTGLEPGKVYQYKVKSVDETGNVSESESFTLLAPSSTESIIEVITDNFTDIFGWLNQ